MDRRTWLVVGVVLLHVVPLWLFLVGALRFETPEGRVRRLLFELTDEPGGPGDFFWNDRRHIAEPELKSLGRAAVPHLIACLRDESRLIRREAVRRLRDLGDARAVPALLAVVGDPDPGVCVELIKALRKLAPGHSADPIISLLRHPQWYPRREAVEALDMMDLKGNRRAIENLRQLCADPEELEDTRKVAVPLLRRLEGG